MYIFFKGVDYFGYTKRRVEKTSGTIAIIKFTYILLFTNQANARYNKPQTTNNKIVTKQNSNYD